MKIPATPTIVGDNFGDMWYKAVRTIMTQGSNRLSEENGIMTKDLYMTLVHYGDAIEQIRNLELHPQFPMGKDGIDAYCNEFTDDFMIEQSCREDIGKFEYTYMERFVQREIDQLENMHCLLRSNGVSRRNQMITWDIEKDWNSDEPPCLQHVQIREVEDGLIDVFIMARSRDIFGAYPSNECGLIGMLDRYVLCGDYDIRMIADTSNNAHVYVHNWDEANSLKAHGVGFRGVEKVKYIGR